MCVFCANSIRRGDEMDIYRVSFFGHRKIDNTLLIEKSLEIIICELLQQHAYVEFLVGREGEFDQLVSSVIRRCKRTIRDDNSAHIWVMPYMSSTYQDNEESFRNYYDEIVVCENSSNSHFKRAYQIRNQDMVNQSNLVVFCVQHESGGAWKTMRYAKKKGVSLLNLNDSKNN